MLLGGEKVIFFKEVSQLFAHDDLEHLAKGRENSASGDRVVELVLQIFVRRVTLCGRSLPCKQINKIRFEILSILRMSTSDAWRFLPPREVATSVRLV